MKKDQRLVKAAFELRLAALIGFAPQLEGCGSCGEVQAPYFSCREGTLLCRECAFEEGSDAVKVSPGVLSAMVYILECDRRRLFSFSLPAASLRELGRITERFLLCQLDSGFTALQFYKRLFPDYRG